MLTRLQQLPRRAAFRPPPGAWAGAPNLFPRLARLRSPVAIAAALVLLLLSQWQSSNSSRTSDPPEPDLPDFDPLVDGAGEVITFNEVFDLFVTECFTSSTTYSGGAVGEDSSNTTCETNERFARSLTWGTPTSTSFDDGMGTTTQSTGRALQLRRTDGSLIRSVGFSSASQITTGPGGTIESRQSETATITTTTGDPVPLPGQPVAPAREARPFPVRPGEVAPATAPPSPARAPGRSPGGSPGPAGAPVPTPAPGGVPGGLPRAPLAPAVPAVVPKSPTLPQNGVDLGPGGQLVPTRPPQTQVTPPGTTFLPPGVPVPPNGPPPTMQGISNELGKLEKKLELALAPEGPLSLLQQLNRAIDQIENIKFLLENLFPAGPYEFGGGAFGLQPVCEKDEFGDPAPPVFAEWPSGQGEFLELSYKIDALASLIQFHKDLKQPICKGGGGNSSNVTVHFESD